jgi:drug/metabolite transporter (DMT)-like permease
MRIPNSTAWGVGLAFATALISGVSVYLNGQYVKLFDDPTLLAAVRNGLVGLVLAGAVVALGGIGELRVMDGRRRAALLVIGIIGGGVPFALFFNGLALAGSPAAALIHKTMFVWVAMLALVALGERLGLAQLAALGLLMLGTLLVAPSGTPGLGFGEAMILVATLLWSVEVVLVRRLLSDGGVSSTLAAASRMVVGSLSLFVVVGAGGGLAGIAAFGVQQWAAIVVTGALLTGYVTTWYAALQRAPATLVTSVLVLGAVVTAALQAATGGAVPAFQALLGHGLLLAGGAVAIIGLRGILRRAPATSPAAVAG